MEQDYGTGASIAGDSPVCNSCRNERPVASYARRKDRSVTRVCKDCINAQTKGRYHKRLISKRAWAKENSRKVREAAISHYGTVCACCGESDIGFLTIDHINDDDAEHRRLNGRMPIQHILKRDNYPEGFQILCYNCNLGRQFNTTNKGICPHKQ